MYLARVEANAIMTPRASDPHFRATKDVHSPFSSQLSSVLFGRLRDGGPDCSVSGGIDTILTNRHTPIATCM